MDINESLQLARKYHHEGNLEQAEYFYKEILKIQPNSAGAYYELASVLHDKGLHDEAIFCYQKSIEFDPNFAGSYYNLANIFKRKNQLNEAIICYLNAIELDKNFLGSYYNLGDILIEQGGLDEATICYQKALQLNPNDIDIYKKLGEYFTHKNQLNKAIAYYKKAIKIEPDDNDIRSRLALTILKSGNLKLGFKELYEDYVLRLKGRPVTSQFLWDGFDIAGQAILIHSTAWSCGDVIQHIRYVPLVAQRGARVFFSCRKELKTLIQNVNGLHKVITDDEIKIVEQLPEFNVHCPIGVLPYIFGTSLLNIPAEIPYISVNTSLVKIWKDKVCHDNSKLKVGLVWAGGTQGNYSLNTYSSFAKLDNITFYSLQIGKASEEAKSPPGGMTLFDYTAQISDFLDTAALIENLDLVISIDTSVAHLAGALGKPVWTLIPFVPDWRWMLNREDSPWYPTMRLFRQPTPGDWESVIAKVKDELHKLL